MVDVLPRSPLLCTSVETQLIKQRHKSTDAAPRAAAAAVSRLTDHWPLTIDWPLSRDARIVKKTGSDGKVVAYSNVLIKL